MKKQTNNFTTNPTCTLCGENYNIESINKGILLLLFYSLGLALPFILSGYLIQRFLIFSKNFKKNINLVSKIGGLILLVTGILILTNQLQALGYYILNIFPFLQNFG